MPCPDGLFWTAEVPRGSIHADVPDGEATMEVSDLAVIDSMNIFNALSCGPAEPATVSFDVEWGPALRRYHAASAAEDFRVAGWLTDSAMSWTAESPGATYQSVGSSVSQFALVVKERNGVFHP